MCSNVLMTRAHVAFVIAEQRASSSIASFNVKTRRNSHRVNWRAGAMSKANKRLSSSLPPRCVRE